MKWESDCSKWMEKQQIKTADKTIPSLVVVSLIYLILCLIFLAFSEPCSSVGIPLISTHLTCLAPNEVGDLLAGLFAPLAFLGLFWAVLIQSRELKAQREELSLTREEMVATRATLGEQANEMKASTKLISEQTQILQFEQNIKIRNEKDKAFDYIISNAESILKNIGSVGMVNKDAPINGRSHSLTIFNFNKDLQMAENFRHLLSHKHHILGQINQILSSDKKDSCHVNKDAVVNLHHLRTRLVELQKIVDECGAGNQERYSYCCINDLIEYLNALLKVMGSVSVQTEI